MNIYRPAALVFGLAVGLVPAILFGVADVARGGAPVEVAAPAAEEGAGAEAQGQAPPTVFELLEKGGPVMYPIYLCSFLMVAFAIERAVNLRRGKVLPADFIRNLRGLASAQPLDRDKILTYCQANTSPIARIFRSAVKRLHRPLPEIEKTIEDAGAKEVRLLKRNTRVLAGVASVAPLLGLLGTVLGMISAFKDISMGEALGKADILASGIYEALVTTAAGLTVAIPSLVLYLVFVARIDKLVGEMDDLTLEFVETIEEGGHLAAA